MQAGIQSGQGMVRNPTVYILASKRNGTLYVGVTSDPVKRLWEHKHDVVDGFTKKYQVHALAYLEQHDRWSKRSSGRSRSRSGIVPGRFA